MNLNYPETAERHLGRTRDITKIKFVLCNILLFPHLLKGEKSISGEIQNYQGPFCLNHIPALTGE